MEAYRTHDNTVAKYVHDDGSETAIKTIPSEYFGGTYGSVDNKYNIFVSHSVGCPVKCSFCYLTVKKCPYYILKANDIIDNVLKALALEIKVRPELKNMYVKLSWMGMGDAFLDLATTEEATYGILSEVLTRGWACGIDGVDIATTLPKIPYLASKQDYVLDNINKYLLYSNKLNPKRTYGKRTPLRVFYSLHSAMEATRKNLIPYTSVPLDEALDYLRLVDAGVQVIFHHMFFDGINDSLEEVSALAGLLEDFSNTELRLLRFNSCEGTNYTESSKFNNIVYSLTKIHRPIKVQASPGSEVKAACGQFLLSIIKG